MICDQLLWTWYLGLDGCCVLGPANGCLAHPPLVESIFLNVLTYCHVIKLKTYEFRITCKNIKYMSIEGTGPIYKDFSMILKINLAAVFPSEN